MYLTDIKWRTHTYQIISIMIILFTFFHISMVLKWGRIVVYSTYIIGIVAMIFKMLQSTNCELVARYLVYMNMKSFCSCVMSCMCLVVILDITSIDSARKHKDGFNTLWLLLRQCLISSIAKREINNLDYIYIINYFS